MTGSGFIPPNPCDISAQESAGDFCAILTRRAEGCVVKICNLVLEKCVLNGSFARLIVRSATLLLDKNFLNTNRIKTGSCYL